VTGTVMRFLIAGGSAAFLNWAARIVLSLAMPFAPAVAIAYGVGMVAGFVLYRSFVWPESGKSWQAQVPPFLAVNLAGGIIVLALAEGALLAGQAIIGPHPLVAPVAHALAIAVGAAANYAGHSAFTFVAATEHA
jgi:energy-coupling factor transport system substrate-specific component